MTGTMKIGKLKKKAAYYYYTIGWMKTGKSRIKYNYELEENK